MIAICELICKEMSHEKVNSGFIYGLSIAFPDETLRFYGAASHIEAIKNILKHDEKFIRKIEYKAIYIPGPESFFAIFGYLFVLLRIFSDVITSNQRRIFFLSFNPLILYVIKLLKLFPSFCIIKFAFVLHGAFESIAKNQTFDQGIDLPIKSLPAPPYESIIHKICRTKLKDLSSKIFAALKNKITTRFFSIQSFRFFSLINVMCWKHTDDYRYIALSPHILPNASKYIDVNRYNIYPLVLPTNFVDPRPVPLNKHVKFAIFGYGDSLVLHNLAYALEQKKPSKKYEIRIIGMDNRGTKGFQNITCFSEGRVLKRADMELQAADIDVFLILYDKSKYRLSCSGSILESISMVKPVLHFDNDCINEFNRLDLPIGIRCESLDDYVNQMVDIIQNFDQYKLQFAEYRKNMLNLRDRLSVEKSAPTIKHIFWGS